MEIARSGESKANSLESIGWITVGVAVLFLVGGVAAAIASDEPTDRAELIIASVAVTLGSLISAAVFLGFASLVRASSRSLAVQVMGSSLNDEDE